MRKFTGGRFVAWIVILLLLATVLATIIYIAIPKPADSETASERHVAGALHSDFQVVTRASLPTSSHPRLSWPVTTSSDAANRPVSDSGGGT
jgi:hypothetical protein